MTNSNFPKISGWSEVATIQSQVKAIFAESYMRDADDFILRASLLQEHDAQHRSFVGKIYVDLLMSIECSLKSAIIFLSPKSEAPKAAYKKARSQGHKIDSALLLVQQRAKRKTAFLKQRVIKFIKNISIDINARYDLELLNIHFNSVKTIDSHVFVRINNPEYIAQLKQTAVDVLSFARRCRMNSRNKSKPMILSKRFKVQAAFAKIVKI